MKSFDHLYKYIKIERAEAAEPFKKGQSKLRLQFVVLGPKEWPPEVVQWFGRRLIKRLYDVEPVRD